MKNLLFIALAIISLTSASCSKDSCLEDKKAEIEKYDRLIEAAQGDPDELQIINRNREIALSKFDC